jgi:hypothetical protein
MEKELQLSSCALSASLSPFLFLCMLTHGRGDAKQAELRLVSLVLCDVISLSTNVMLMYMKSVGYIAEEVYPELIFYIPGA